MILSDKFKFIFIRPQKIAGTSLEQAINKIDKDCWKFKKEDQKSILKKTNVQTDPYHLPNYVVKKLIAEWKYNNYYKFSFTRNPWSRMVSTYQYWQTHGGSKQGKANKKDITFKNFIKNANNKYWAGAFLNHVDFIGNVDFIGKIENIQSDFNIICDNIGVPHQKLPHKNTTSHKHYSEYYDAEARELVADRYSKDIEHFGYKFEKS